MNKPEPLKDKIVEIDSVSWTTTQQIGTTSVRAIHISDIKSAVEWLKKEIYECEMLIEKSGSRLSNIINLYDVINVIDKAFEDVTKK